MHYMVSLSRSRFQDNVDYDQRPYTPFQRLLYKDKLAFRDTVRSMVQEKTGIETSVFDWTTVFTGKMHGPEGCMDITHHVIVTVVDLEVMLKARNANCEVVPVSIGMRQPSELSWMLPLAICHIQNGQLFPHRKPNH
jgi:hypothetical protein